MEDNQRKILADTVSLFLERKRFTTASLENSDLLIKADALQRCMDTSAELEEGDLGEARRLVEFFGEELPLELPKSQEVPLSPELIEAIESLSPHC